MKLISRSDFRTKDTLEDGVWEGRFVWIDAVCSQGVEATGRISKLELKEAF